MHHSRRASRALPQQDARRPDRPRRRVARRAAARPHRRRRPERHREVHAAPAARRARVTRRWAGRSPSAWTVGYLPQEPDAQPGETLLAYLARRTGVAAAEEELEALTERLGTEPHLAAEHAGALDRFLALGGDDLPQRARAIAAQVGLAPERLERRSGRFSGARRRGPPWRRSSSPASTSCSSTSRRTTSTSTGSPSSSVPAWTRGALVLVSHDRELLDRTRPGSSSSAWRRGARVRRRVSRLRASPRAQARGRSTTRGSTRRGARAAGGAGPPSRRMGRARPRRSAEEEDARDIRGQVRRES